MYRDIHHCGVPKILVIASIDKSLSDIFDSNVFNDKLRADKNNLWVNVNSFDIENFENDILTFKETENKNDIIVADPKYNLKWYKRHNHRGFTPDGLKTTPAIAGAWYLYLYKYIKH